MEMNIMSKDAYYFPHDSNARNDQRIMKVRMKYGMEGYGVYFGLIEILREQENYILHHSDIESIAFDLRVDVEKLKDIIHNHYLFEARFDKNAEEGYFYSKSLKRRMEKLDLIKQKRADAGRKGGKSKPNANQVINKESKVKKSKVKKTKLNISFNEFWDLYNYKVGKKETVMAKWESLKDIDRQEIMNYLPGYIQSKPDKQFRKHPTTFLNNEGWKDEIIISNNGSSIFKEDTAGFPMAYCEKCGVSESYRYEELNGDSRCCNGKLLPERPVAV